MEINKLIDHTNLYAFASVEDITKLCEEAKENHFCSVCVNPFYVPVADKLLSGSDVKVCTVIGFPLGQNTPTMKAAEAAEAVKLGADEIDMVLNISMVKEHDYNYIEKEVRKVKEACDGRLLKVILEICYLTNDEIRDASIACKKAGADFVKTSTGFGKGGATVEAVKIMRKAVGPELGVKAAGGIHSYKEVLGFVKAGANRIGCSRGIDIMKEAK